MDAMRIAGVAAAVLLGMAIVPLAKVSAVEPDVRQKLLYGPTTQVDPSFAYYQGRTPESIADELALRGYQAIHLVITSEANPHAELIRALKARGIAVWGMVWGGGTYSTAGYPPNWPEWRQTLIKPQDVGGFIYLSPFHPEFRRFKRERIAQLVQEHPLDGIEIVEAFWPNWDGLRNGVYGDIGPWAAKAFKEKTGEEMPNFTDRSSPRYYTKVPELYQKWVDFRVQAETDFIHEIINGPGGVREVRPDIVVATWSLATDHYNALQKTREDIGEDPALMVSTVKPDIHFYQTNWPDWIKPSLAPTYPLRYKVFVDAVRAVAPELPLGLQADIGSLENMRRDWPWIRGVEEAARQAGFQTTTLYEYHIGLYMYTEPPKPVVARRGGPGWVLISFNKRVDGWTARDPENYRLIGAPGAEVRDAAVDGNIVMLRIDGLPAHAFDIVVSGVRDTPELWLLKGKPANTVPPGSKVGVPAQ